MIRLTGAVLMTMLAAAPATALAADDGAKTASSAVVTGDRAVTIFAARAESAPRPQVPITSTQAAPAPTRGRVLPILYVNYAALQAYDGYTTISGVKRGAREANPMMSSLAGRPAAVWAVKGGVTAASIFLAERLWTENRRGRAITTMIISSALMGAVAANNSAVLRAQR
jgi:hypothetical protein